MRKIDSIIVHCTATSIYCDPDTVVDYHKNVLHWSDCGYHFMIDYTGVVYEMRPVEQIGAHCIGQNKSSIGVALIGGEFRADFTFDQYFSLLALLKRLSVTYKIDKSYIFPHYSFTKDKSCPRFDVQNLIRYEKGFFKNVPGNS